MIAGTLFDLAAVAPSRGELRAAAAEERREERKKRSAAWRWKNDKRAREREEKEARFAGGNCRTPGCVFWYQPGHGWSNCHGCGAVLG